MKELTFHELAVGVDVNMSRIEHQPCRIVGCNERRRDARRELDVADTNARKTNAPERSYTASLFAKGEDGQIFHTYSCYARGLDMLNGAYQLLDIVPKGRDEQGLAHPMAWVRRHDKYD